MLSRGCRPVVSVEMDRDHARFIAECMKKIGTNDNILIKGDVFRFVKRCHQQFDLIFADPPYALETPLQLPDLILDGGLLKEGGVFVFEHGKTHDFSAHPRFVEHRSYGKLSTSHCFSDCCRGTLFIVTLP